MRFSRRSYDPYYRPSSFGFSFFPPVIKTLLIANAAVFIFVKFFGQFRLGDSYLGNELEYWFGLLPLDIGFLPWQLFTYMFIHANLGHIFFNMFALWMFGVELENTWGSKKFATYYLLCGVGAGLANLLIAPLFTSTGITIGASGAVYGVLLAFGMLFPDRLIFLYFFVPVKAKYFVAFYMISEFVTVGLGGSDGIAHFAHLGGAFVGFVFIIAEGYGYSLFDSSGNPTVLGNRKSRSSDHFDYGTVSDAKVFEIQDYKKKTEEKSVQDQVNEILDKISKGGYQSLTDEEKKILFEASKKLN